ncbi:MAG: tRNA adenosine(34) deaminase TadA [Woeseiaceae bacterium]|nr:tRNA adenosine(34) deaminase TadA [Woeseiaceae bacterium]MDG1016496.1 tRNA adenosine(34) deaminase TadA [Woeseiaceae bacterium]
MGFTAQDQHWMQLALAQAEQAAIAGEVPVGAVIIAADQKLAAAHNRTILNQDPTAHAEILVLRQAAQHQGNHRLLDTTIYITLEPCAMCVGAMIQARIQRCVYGASDPKSGAVGSVLDLSAHAKLNHSFSVAGGLFAAESATLLQTFFKARR